MGTGRTVRRIATGAVVTAGAAALAGGYVLRRPVPRAKGKRSLKGLRRRCEIIRDRWGVPHIYASNIEDMCVRASGTRRRRTDCGRWSSTGGRHPGRLAELLGEQALEIDRMTRRVGFRRAAERDWLDADAEERAVLEAFAAGVNAYSERATDAAGVHDPAHAAGAVAAGATRWRSGASSAGRCRGTGTARSCARGRSSGSARS